ncbi:hypothetical protein MrNuV_ORF110 [Macrobrachium rosenbergii nudivirus]|nr:hypothetical protein MrNuV_ORF110 [Macrobrachium rosenbergii nudivirus]
MGFTGLFLYSFNKLLILIVFLGFKSSALVSIIGEGDDVTSSFSSIGCCNAGDSSSITVVNSFSTTTSSVTMSFSSILLFITLPEGVGKGVVEVEASNISFKFVKNSAFIS